MVDILQNRSLQSTQPLAFEADGVPQAAIGPAAFRWAVFREAACAPACRQRSTVSCNTARFSPGFMSAQRAISPIVR
jgi:hypothetical protein